MLRKLLKYEFIGTGRACGLLYTAVPVVALLIGLLTRFKLDGGMLFGMVLMLFMGLCIAAICLSIYVMVNRFNQNLLGDEGYMMFTLPAETWQHIVCKVINALIWMVICSVMFFLSFLLIALSSATLDDFREFFTMLQYLFQNLQFSTDDLVFILQLFTLMTLSTVSIITHVYAAISIGHLWRNHTGIGATIAAIVIMIFFFYALDFVNPTTFGLGVLFFVVIIALYSAITWFILDRNLNLA